MSADFSNVVPIPISSSTTTSLDYHSRIGVTVLVSVVALFLICSLVVFAQYCFSNHHHEQITATPLHTSARSGSRVAPPPQPPQCLDADAVAALPVVRCSGGGEGCAVCLVEYADKEKVKVIPGCGHGFHSSCIETWLMWRGTCPICRCSDIWGPWSREICARVFDCDEGNVGKLRTSRSYERCCVELEAGGGGSGGAMLLRRTCSV